MANKYVDSNAAGAGTGADWANAYTTLTLAIAGSAAGDDLWVAHNHAESTAGAVTLTFPGTSASPNRVICVTSAGSVPPVAADVRTTGTVSTTGANSITFRGNFYCYGLTFNAGSAANTAHIAIGNSIAAVAIFDSCNIVLNNTSTTSQLYIGVTGNNRGYVKFNNTPVTFGANQYIQVAATIFEWENTAPALLGTAPTNLISPNNDRLAVVYMTALDLSSTNNTLFASTNSIPSRYYINRCKLGASVTVLGTPSNNGGPEAYVNYSGNSTSLRQEKYNYLGTETIETTIVRTGGASIGGTAIAKKYVTTANAKRIQPFESIPIAVANTITASNRVITVYGIWGGGAVPTSADIWFDVVYPGSATSVLGSLVSTATTTVLTAGTNWTADTSTWGGSTTKFKMTATLSSPQPQLAGEFYIRVFCAAASTTFYIDPKVELS